jgi:hypothetical protein
MISASADSSATLVIMGSRRKAGNDDDKGGVDGREDPA